MSQPLYGSRHEGPFTPMFEGRHLHLVVGALTLDVVGHTINRPARTWVKEASDTEAREMPDSLTGLIYGRGHVEMSRTKAYLELDGDELASIPHGTFEPLTDAEGKAHATAEWKFHFDYTIPPHPQPM